MGVAEKFLMGLVGIGLVTTLILPDRQTPKVLDSFTRLVRGGLSTAMTGKA